MGRCHQGRLGKDDAEMSTTRILVDENGWKMESGDYALEVSKANLVANLRIDDQYVCEIPNAPDFFRAMKAMAQAFGERHGE